MNAFQRLHELRMKNTQAGYDMDEKRGRFDAIRMRHGSGTAPRAVSSFQLFQTPPEIAQRMAAQLYLKRGARVLEPSAGLGRLLDVLDSEVETVAVEKSPECAAELFRQNRPGMTLKQRDFLTLTVEEIGTFDAVIMNPPFHMRDDIRHIEHALGFIRPGGTLVALCMDTKHREERLKPIADRWEPLPCGTFSKEGTGIGVVLLKITK